MFPVVWWLKGWRCLSEDMLGPWLADAEHRKQLSECSGMSGHSLSCSLSVAVLGVGSHGRAALTRL